MPTPDPEEHRHRVARMRARRRAQLRSRSDDRLRDAPPAITAEPLRRDEGMKRPMTQQDYRLSPQQPNLRHLLQIFPVARIYHLRRPEPLRSRRFALPTEIWKTTPCKVAGGRWHDAFEAAKVFDTSGKSAALLYHHAIRKTPMALPDMGLPNMALPDMALPDDGRCGAMTRKTPYRPLKLHRLAAASDRLLVAEPRASLARVRREIST